MKSIQIHRSEGLQISEDLTEETVYLHTLEQAAQDAEMSLSWPEANVLRIFQLNDGRIVVVRETLFGLSQEAASPAVQTLYQAVLEKAEVLIQKEAERQASEASDEAPSDEV